MCVRVRARACVCVWARVSMGVCVSACVWFKISQPGHYPISISIHNAPKKSTISLSQAILWLEVTVRYAVLCQEPQTHGQFLAETQHLVKVIARSILYLYLPSLMEVSILAMEQLY